MKTYAQRTLKLAPEAVTRADVPALLEALRPTLNTLVGRSSTDALLEKIQREMNA